MAAENRLRVVVYVHDLRASGVVRNTLTIAERLASEHQTILVAGYAEGLFEANASNRPFQLVVLANGEPGWAARLRSAMRLARWLGDIPTLLISAGNFGHPTVWLACRGKAKVRRIYRMSNEIGRTNPVMTGLRTLWARILASDATRLIMVGGSVGRSPALAPSVQSGRARVISNGVDLEAAQARSTAPCPHPWLEDDIPVVIGIGRLHSQKNFPLLIDAVAAVRRKRAVRLLIIGGGTRAAREALQARADSAGLNGDFALGGETDNVFAWLSRADVFALSSQYEGSSVALLEALAAGVPVVATGQAGDAVEVLDHGRYGLLVDANDLAAFTAAIITQLSADRVMPGNRVLRYSLDAMKESYARLVNEIVGSE